jgi:hypothetical protein
MPIPSQAEIELAFGEAYVPPRASVPDTNDIQARLRQAFGTAYSAPYTLNPRYASNDSSSGIAEIQQAYATYLAQFPDQAEAIHAAERASLADEYARQAAAKRAAQSSASSGGWALPFLGGYGFGQLGSIYDDSRQAAIRAHATSPSSYETESSGWFWPALAGYSLQQLLDFFARPYLAAETREHIRRAIEAKRSLGETMQSPDASGAWPVLPWLGGAALGAASYYGRSAPLFGGLLGIAASASPYAPWLGAAGGIAASRAWRSWHAKHPHIVSGALSQMTYSESIPPVHANMPVWTFVKYEPIDESKPNPAEAITKAWPVRVLRAEPRGAHQWHVQLIFEGPTPLWQPPTSPQETPAGTLEWRTSVDVASGWPGILGGAALGAAGLAAYQQYRASQGGIRKDLLSGIRQPVSFTRGPTAASGAPLFPWLGGAVLGAGAAAAFRRWGGGPGPVSSGADPTSSFELSTPVHIALGPKPDNEKGIDCSVRLIKEGTTWKAIATCSTSQGPFRLEADVDEALVARYVGPLRAPKVAADAARQQVLAKVGSARWGEWRLGESLLLRLESRDPAAWALVSRIRACAPTNPRCRRILHRLRELRQLRLEGMATTGGWPFPEKMRAGIDLDSQVGARPNKSLPTRIIDALKKSIRRSA